MVAPGDRRIVVFSGRICSGLNGLIVAGGHVQPSSMVGKSLLWKNAQKNEVKENPSEVMNRIISHRSAFFNMYVWRACYGP
jgi:hypothetical protein